MQTLLNNAVKAQRARELAESNQLTLGELILKVEAIANQVKERMGTADEPLVQYDFEYLYPTALNSWRGIYAELALNFVHQDYENKNKQLNISQFLELLRGAVGKEYTGYKGGEFVMSRQTPIWVANYGNSGRTAVVDVKLDYWVVIITQYQKDSL